MSLLTSGDVKIDDMIPPLILPPINRTTLALFAGASGDHNPIHIDIDYARRAGMSDVIAHGMLSMAYLGRLLTQSLDQRRLRSFGVRFVDITHLGHEITCTGKICEIFEANGERRARLEIQTHNQHGEVKTVGDAVVVL